MSSLEWESVLGSAEKQFRCVQEGARFQEAQFLYILYYNWICAP